MKIVKTYQYRIRNKTRKLDQMSRHTKRIWNVINSVSRNKWNKSRKYFHKFDPFYTDIVKGASKELSINSQTIQMILAQFHKDIRQAKKQLRFKGRKTLGWIPIQGQTFKIKEDRVIYNKQHFKFKKHRELPENAKICCGSFTQDTLGNWFVNITVEYDSNLAPDKDGSVGIDLGLKTTATCSNGKTLTLNNNKNKKFKKLIGRQQRAKNTKRVKRLHKKRANIKKDKINKFASELVKLNTLIAVGNVSGFTKKGKMADSRYQNSWSMLKTRLKHKSMEYNVHYIEIDEAYSTQTCNVCGNRTGPKSIKELSVRYWECSSCRTGLNRDLNAAINILNVGLGT